MSDLQLSLVLIGLLVIACVYLFNWAQERRFRRRLGQAFSDEREDALLKSAAPAAQRAEPQIARGPERGASDETPDSLPSADKPVAAASTGPVAEFDSLVDYMAQIDGSRLISERSIAELIARMAACGKPYRIAGFNPQSGAWDDLSHGGHGTHTKVRVAVQLVNRSGTISAAQLSMVCDAVKHCAEQSEAVASCPDNQVALRAARDLDDFCGEVDVAIGVNIVATEDRVFAGARIRALAEEVGFRLEPDGVFRYRDDRHRALFSLDNHDPAPFLPEQVKTMTTRGLTLLFDVPRVHDGLEALDRMFEVATRLAPALEGRLVDDNRAELNASGFARIRQQVAGIYAKMEARGIAAGSPCALRLFS